MCGIVGALLLSPDGQIGREVITEKSIRKMCSVVKHRGPDDEGIYVSKGVGLGMRRLSIIDIEGGRQPIASEDGSIYIIFNGEIYNHLEIRRDLEGKGHVYTTRTDTETILHLYEEVGEKCVEYLNGMFGIAIWDEKNSTLFLARDRLGIKPLYYSSQNGVFLFGSEIKSILEYPGFIRSINEKVLGAYLSLLYIPNPYSMFKDIYKLPPAHTLTLRHGQIRMRRYWSVLNDHFVNSPRCVDHYICEIEERLSKSVQKRLIAEVPLGAFLSGGVDSSLVVSSMSRISEKPVKAFTMDFNGGGKKFSEVSFARKVARHCGVEHYVREVTVKDLVDLIQKLAWHFDEPFADSSMLPTFMVCQFAREAITVALSGDGGDELFGGYENYKRNKMFEYFRRLPKSFSIKIIPWFTDFISRRAILQGTIWPFRIQKFNKLIELSPAERHAVLATHFDLELRRELLVSKITSEWDPFKDLFEPIWLEHNDEEIWNQVFRLDIETYLPEDILTKIDRASMANSLEARVPFLDHEFVEYVCRLPAHLKLYRLQTKHILKCLARKNISKVTFTRRKQGFSIPINEWLRGELKNFCYDLLIGNRQHMSGLFKISTLEKVLHDHMNNKRNFGHHLWAIMIFELWHNTFISSKV